MAPRRPNLQLEPADWFAAAVNLVGVLLGVLLAFQIERWNEARRDRREESAYLERLWTESAANIREADRLRDRNFETARQLRAIDAALSDPPRLAALETTPEFGCGMLQLPATPLSNTAYEELTQGDRIDLIRDEGLKERIRATMAYQTFLESQLSYFRASFTTYRQRLEPYHLYRIDRGDGGVDCTLRLGALGQDPVARQLLAKVYRDQLAFSRYREELSRRLHAQRDHLACLLRKPECKLSGRSSPR